MLPLQNLRKQPLTPTLSPQERGEGEGRLILHLIYPPGANESARASVQASRKRGSLVPSINSPGSSDG
jgi:hypothetical protein